MAVDTSRERLERLSRRSKSHRLWGRTWTEPSAHLRSTAPRRRRASWLAPALSLALALGLYWQGPPELRAWVDGALGRLAFLGAPGCGDVAVRYDRAVRSLGSSSARATQDSFADAQSGCAAEAAAFRSTSRADTCRAGASHFGRALERRQAIASVAAVQPASGTIGQSAAGIVGGDDIDEVEALARRMMVECTT